MTPFHRCFAPRSLPKRTAGIGLSTPPMEMEGELTDPGLSYSCTTIVAMVVRRKRSISMPPDLDTDIEAAASAAGMTYSGWLAAMARKEFKVRAGLDAVAGFEKEHGSFTPDELVEAETWAKEALVRSNRTGARRRRTA